MIGWKAIACALGAVGLALAVWLAWPRTSPVDAAAPTRQYLDTSACLLTVAAGVTGDPQAAVWQGMEDASLATHVRAEYLAVRGPGTEANALPYLASLLQRRCGVVLAVGPAQVAAAAAEAGRFPRVRFIAIGNQGIAPPVATVAAPRGHIRGAVRDAVTTALSQEGRS